MAFRVEKALPLRLIGLLLDNRHGVVEYLITEYDRPAMQHAC
jgi:hypothetical protein